MIIRVKPSISISTLLIGVFIFTLFLIFRNAGLYPTVFADEYVYSKLSRLLPLSESTVPGYLYLKLYSYTNYCDDGFLGCVKAINAALFSLAIPFIYFTTRTVAARGVSMVVALLAVFGPINTYTAYFMPESLYFLSFWVFCWFLIKLNFDSHGCKWFTAGVIFGVSALIKPHSIFFLPAIFAYITFIFYQGRSLLSWHAFYSAALFFIGAFIIKFSVSYIFAGMSGLTVFGPLYSSLAQSSATDFSRYVEILGLAAVSAKGHFFTIAIIYGLPVGVALSVAVNAFFGRSNGSQSEQSKSQQLEKITFLALLIVLNLIFVVALFTASVANSGAYETPYRLHLRYYNFALPLFYIIAAGALSMGKVYHYRYFRCAVGGIIAAISTFAIYTNLAPYTPGIVDSPEIRGLHANFLSFQVIGGALILSLLSWMISEKVGIKIYLYFAMPLFVFTAYYYVISEQRNRMVLDNYDKAGIFAKQYLSSDEISKTVVIGSVDAALLRTLFYLDNPKASFEMIPQGSIYEKSMLAPGKEWVLVVGDHELPYNEYFQFKMNGFTLAKPFGSKLIDFSKSFLSGVIVKVRGLSSPEAWGSWSDTDIVTFEFASPLPKEFEVQLVALAYGPIAGEDFEVHVGESKENFKLLTSAGEIILKLKNPSRESEISFKVPKPISPKELNMEGDERRLGIGFVEMKIVPL